MTESMTGHGRGEHRGERYQVGIEIRSVNHRFLDIKLRLPRELAGWEDEFRAGLRRRFARGAVDLQAALEREPGTGRRFVVDEELLAQAADGLARAARRIGAEARFDIATLAQFREIFRIEADTEEEGELQAGVAAAFEAACADLEAARRREGAALAAVIGSSLALLRDLLGQMQEAAPAVARQLKETIAARAAELLEGGRLDPGRLEQEAALLAMKSDVSEELARFAGHLAACEAAIAGGGPAGRQMDFLLQEMHRELNTAAAKANTFALAQVAIRGKIELEKVREQVQNLA